MISLLDVLLWINLITYQQLLLMLERTNRLVIQRWTPNTKHNIRHQVCPHETCCTTTSKAVTTKFMFKDYSHLPNEVKPLYLSPNMVKCCFPFDTPIHMIMRWYFPVNVVSVWPKGFMVHIIRYLMPMEGTPILGHGREVLRWWPPFLRFVI